MNYHGGNIKTLHYHGGSINTSHYYEGNINTLLYHGGNDEVEYTKIKKKMYSEKAVSKKEFFYKGE